MRNLKRALSLALASVMVMSMMVIGAGAASYDDFSDKDKIVNKEAVQMLVELGVINGKDTGDFDPTGIVTRAEMAKMICVVLNGGKDPSLGSTVTNSYTDTVGHWAAGYIEYCTQLGIVAGDGAGKFNPNTTVTGSEAAKMLLVALGYKSEVEGFIGANWAIGVNVRANQKGLYSDLTISVDEGLTRDSAAQMIYNALDAGVVHYDYTLVSDGSTISSSPTLIDENKKTLLEDKFNAVKVEGVVVANEVANLTATSEKGASLDEGKTSIAITNDDDQSAYAGTKTFAVSTGMDDLGRAVVVYVKKDSNSTKAEVLGAAITSADNKVVVDTSKDSIKDVADDNDLTITAETKVAANYGNLVAYSKYTDPKAAGIEKILVDTDDDGDVDYVLMNTYAFGKVTTYTTAGDGSIAVSAGTYALSADDKDDVVGFDDVAKNDYVMAAYIGGDLHVAKAETVVGMLEAYKGSNPATKLTVDGTDYNVSNIANIYTGGEDDIAAAKGYGTNQLDNEATFYLDKNGLVVAVGNVSENAYNYALVLATGTTGLEDRVRVALSDGTVATYDYTSNSDTPSYGQVYSYSINSKNQIRLTAVASDNTKALDTSLTFKKGLTSIKADEGTVYANSNTAFFYVKDANLTDNVIDSDNVSVYTGYANAPTLESGVKAVAYTRGDSTSTRAAAVVFYAASLTTTEVSDSLYISSVGTKTSDYINATAFLPGNTEAQSIKVDINSAVAKETAYTYTVNSDGTYELSTAKYNAGNQITSGTVSGVSGSTFVVGSKEFKVTSDTLFVDHSKYLNAPTAELNAGPDVDDVIRTVIYNSDMEAILVVIANPKVDGGDDLSTDVVVIDADAGNFFANPTFYRESGTAITAAEKQIALTNWMTKNGYTEISFEGISKVTYTYNGATNTATITSANQVYKVAAPAVGTTAAVNGVKLTNAEADVKYAEAGGTVTITVTTDKGNITNTKTNTITATGTNGDQSPVTGTADTAQGDGSTPALETYTVALTMPAYDLTEIKVTMADRT